jgi:hypothetical protein
VVGVPRVAGVPKVVGVPRVVGLGRLERPTSPLSGVRSNHLSYRPVASRFKESASARHLITPIHMCCPEEKEKRRRRMSRIAGPDWPLVFKRDPIKPA